MKRVAILVLLASACAAGAPTAEDSQSLGLPKPLLPPLKPVDVEPIDDFATAEEEPIDDLATEWPPKVECGDTGEVTEQMTDYNWPSAVEGARYLVIRTLSDLRDACPKPCVFSPTPSPERHTIPCVRGEGPVFTRKCGPVKWSCLPKAG